ncbi:MAG TPA: shikimate kinase [Pyrinomonadaceae bacterium]|nr:shikimate kinase [Pyrinomonadaceae bacterium]
MTRVVILGFMACGKTTVAKEVARQLDAEFIDLDFFLSHQQGRSPAEIIATDGEPAFREAETAALNEVLTKTEARVIALGGGTWTIAANRTLVTLHDCVTVWLDAPFDICWQRIINSETVRPLAPDREAARRRFDSRRADYSLAEHTIAISETDSQETIASQILPLC